MDKRVIWGGVAGGGVTLIFALGILLIFNRFSLVFVTSTDNMLINLAAILLAPIAGGFLAGIIAVEKPRLAGLIAGLGASLFVFILWLVISGLVMESALSGLVISFVWVFLARIGAGFSSS